MTAYYNEIDPYAAQWLRNLIDAGHIARGDVDERSIIDVRADDLRGYTQCHFFAGIGGWSVALRLAGWPDGRPVWTGSCPCQPFSAGGAGKAGSMLFSLTWKAKGTPAGRPYSQLAASARPMSGTDFGSWATPNFSDYRSESATPEYHQRRWDHPRGKGLSEQVRLTVSGPTPNGSSAPMENVGQLDPQFSRWLMGYSADHLSCAPTETLSFLKSQRSSS